MKSLLIALSTASLLAVTAGGAMAAPGKHSAHRVTPGERIAIAKSAAHVAQVKKRAWADGRLTRGERVQIRMAESRHRALVARAYR